MVFAVMANVVVAFIDTACIAVARKVAAYIGGGLYSWGLYSCALYSYGLYSYGVYSYGLRSCGLCSFDVYGNGLNSYDPPSAPSLPP